MYAVVPFHIEDTIVKTLKILAPTDVINAFLLLKKLPLYHSKNYHLS